ncbi:MAG: hypothetical protein NTW14_11930 [bacterium]|nr:hypothetical protein [bacterium]
MCIIIDADTLACVFNKICSDHVNFKPVLQWINKSGFIVYGGSTYKRQLKAASSYWGIFIEYKKIRKAVEVDESLVDEFEKEAKKIIPAKKFDDPHLVAIVKVSGCKLLCSNDGKADKYIGNKKLYNRKENQHPPKIYRGLKHRHLLNDKNIVNIRNVINA